MSDRRQDLHAAIVEALQGRGLNHYDQIADAVLADPRVLPLIEGVGSEERERMAWLVREAATRLDDEGWNAGSVLRVAAALLRAGPASEPVAWMVTDRWGGRSFRIGPSHPDVPSDWPCVPLYRSAGPKEAKEGLCMRCFVAVTEQWVPLCETCHPRCVKEWYPPTEANEPGGGASEDTWTDRYGREQTVPRAAPQEEPRTGDAEATLRAWAALRLEHPTRGWRQCVDAIREAVRAEWDAKYAAKMAEQRD